MNAKKNARKSAQGLTEYVILVVLVAVAVLGAVRLFGLEIWGQTVDATIEVGTLND